MRKDHLETEARVHRMSGTTREIKIMAHSDLGVRILIIEATRDMVQTRTRIFNQVEDLGAGTGLTTAQMYGVLELSAKQ